MSIIQDEVEFGPNFVIRTIGTGVFIGESRIDDAGDGLYTSKDSPAIARGDLVVEYGGMLITAVQFRKLMENGTYS
jgi:hypothetical protein